VSHDPAMSLNAGPATMHPSRSGELSSALCAITRSAMFCVLAPEAAACV